ncbi:MAG: CehA/McbA family metallohydrolase [Caulobacteraceae bacterium]|nr:CehA/McbA family metallohydrolase [Caulobacteraceae bacterium]
MRRLATLLAAWLALLIAAPALADPAPDLTLAGTLTGADHQTYRELAFRVPKGVKRIDVAVEYDRAEKTTIDLGLRDPQRFRGWSGGNKAGFFVGETQATPSYLPGPLPAGEWRLVLGVPNIREASRAAYTARIWFDRPQTAPLASGARWYRGDFHTHTGHSDGYCASRRGAKAPCPLVRTLEAAAARGLDFVAITDHNTTSHLAEIAALQPAFDDLLVIPGREITTFHGHFNVFGALSDVDFQLGGPRAPDIGRILDQVEKAGGLASINHPSMPSGEVCMGCGWTVEKTPFARFAAVEVANGGALALTGNMADDPLSGVGFWEARLAEGARLTAIGGSDNHDALAPPDKPPAVGRPTTVVWAEALSTAAILEGVRKGRVFIDFDGTGDRLLEFTAFTKTAKALPGDTLQNEEGAVDLSARVIGAEGATLMFVSNDPNDQRWRTVLKSNDETVAITALTVWGDGGGPTPPTTYWTRAEVRARDGRLLMLSNPIHIVTDLDRIIERGAKGADKPLR